MKPKEPASRTTDTRLAPKQRVYAAQDLPGVPAGTAGKVTMVEGLSWTRYRVRFANGVDLGSIDAGHLTTEPPES